MRKVVGFYKKNGRTRPITARTRLRGDRLRMDNMQSQIRESEIPEKYRLWKASDAIKSWSDDPKKQEEHRQQTINYLERRIEEFRNALWIPYLANERAENFKIMRYFQQKLKEYQRYRVPSTNHLYKNGAKKEKEREFEKRYGKKRGDYVYGATVGKVRRERLAKTVGGKR
jgi:hypothetical protein